MSNYIGKEIKKGFIWNFTEQASFKVMQFVIQIVLARLLMPEDYGLVTIALAFVNFANVFVSAGFGSALIFKKDATSKDFSSVCWLSIVVSIVLYALLFLCAPIIADFYSDERIILIIRIMSVSLILGAFNSVQVSMVQKNMQFKKSFVGNVIGVTSSFVLGIIAAYLGYGVWSLVIQYITNRVVSTLSFYFMTKWLPKYEFSWASVRLLFSYGWKLMLSSVLSTLSSDIYSLVIGKQFSKAQLGTYDTGVKIPANLGNTVSTALGTVLFPAFSRLQNDTLQIREYLKKSNLLSTFIVFPMLYTVAGLADPIVRVVFTEKWIESVPFLQIACVTYSFYPIHLANLQVAKAVGRPDLGLYMEVGKKMIDILMLLITIRFGIYWVAIGLSFSTVCALWINIEPIKKYIKYSTIQQLKDVFPSWIISMTIAVTLYFISNLLDCSSEWKLFIGSVIGLISLMLLTIIFNRHQLQLFMNQVKTIINR